MVNESFSLEPRSKVLLRRELGSTGLQVTSICIGTAALGNMPQDFGFSVSEQRAKKVLRAAFSSQINFIDTAASYGESEKRIGEVIREVGGLPKGVVLATKADRDMRTGDFSGEQIKRSVERSLERLGLNKLALIYIHDPEHSTFEQIMSENGPFKVLQKYKEEGVIEHIGISGGPINMLIEYVNTGKFEVAITHNRYNLLYQTASSLLDAANKKGVAVINAAPFGSGILAKGSIYSHFAYRPASDDIIKRVKQIEAICQRYKVPLAAVALQFSLKDNRIASTIIGVAKEKEVDQAIEYANYSIPEGLWSELEKFKIVTGDPEQD